ncbi:MAG: chromosomal replication initiator protein DnaA [Alphaproteobacteria bacterium]|nr:chromosomal replication initiator protein DnaA [Alphaproteobacteria bacterium]
MSKSSFLDNADLQEKWGKAVQIIRQKVGESVFESWLKNINLSSVSKEGSVEISVPTRFMKNWVTQNYKDIIVQALKAVEFGVSDVEFSVKASIVLPKVKARDLNESQTRCEVAEPGKPVLTTDLDSKNTFENFISGKPNEFALAAAKRFADCQDAQFNPLFFYSSVGLGKTHLMQAIAWHMQKHHPKVRVAYLSVEKFINSFVSALKYRSVEDFQEIFRSTEVLLIDDVQFLTGKTKTQEEFFHTFNALIDKGSRLVLAADRSPAMLEGIESRLKSRMSGGLVADILPTTYELRLDILKSKCRMRGVTLQPEVLEFLAFRVNTNVRELEGALSRIIAKNDMEGSHQITVARAEEILKDILGACTRRLTLDEIQKRVAEHYKITQADILSKRRDRDIARPRQVAMYLSKRLTTRSLPEIGQKFKKDHSTVIHAVRMVETLVAKDQKIAKDVDTLRASLTT